MKTRTSSARRLGLGLACGVLTLAGSGKAAETLSFTRLASWPGYSMGTPSGADAMHFQDSVVWLALDGAPSGCALLAIDVSNPVSPVLRSSTLTGAGGWRAFEGGFAYLWGESGWLEIYDLAEPRRAVLRSRTSVPKLSGRMSAYNGHLWVVTGDRVEVYDVRDPSAPRRVGGLLHEGLPNLADPMIVCGGFGVIKTSRQSGISVTGRLQVIDLTNPVQPAKLGAMEFTGDYGWSLPEAVAPMGEYLYYTVYDSGSYRLRAVKITTAGNLESTEVDLPISSDSAYQRMWSVGDYLYLPQQIEDAGNPAGALHRLRVVDVTQRLQPIEVAPQAVQGPLFFWQLTGHAGRVFLLCGGLSHALVALDATDPAHPVEVGTRWRDWGQQPRLYGLVGATSEPIWRVMDEGSTRLRLFRASSLLEGNPRTFCELDLSFDSPQLREALLHGDYCYVLSTLPYPDERTWLDVFDLSTAGTPVHLGRQLIIPEIADWQPGAGYHAVKIAGDLLFVSHSSLLDIYSLSTPGSPELMGQADTGVAGMWHCHVEIHQGYAYVFGNAADARLVVVDVRQPANPSPASTVRTVNGFAGGMAVDGGLLYAVFCDWNVNPNATTLEVFDLADPLSPVLVSSTRVADGKVYVSDVAIQHPYAVLGGQSGLLAVDISDPRQPRALAAYAPFPQLENAASSVNEVKGWQNHFVIQDDYGGIVLLDLARVLSGLTLQPWWGNSARLTWAGAPGISLQRTTALPGPWDTVPNTDGRSEAFVSLGSPQAFFRLVQP